MIFFSFFTDDDEATFNSIYEALASEWITAELDHKISFAASNDLWRIATQLIPTLMEAKAREGNNRKVPQFRSIRNTMYKEKVPRIKLEFAYEVKETGDIIILGDLDSSPGSKFPPSKFTKLYESAKVEVIIIRSWYSLSVHNFLFLFETLLPD